MRHMRTRALVVITLFELMLISWAHGHELRRAIATVQLKESSQTRESLLLNLEISIVIIGSGQDDTTESLSARERDRPRSIGSSTPVWVTL